MHTPIIYYYNIIVILKGLEHSIVKCGCVLDYPMHANTYIYDIVLYSTMPSFWLAVVHALSTEYN